MSKYEVADDSCPNCGRYDTHVDVTRDVFHCADCGFSDPIEQVTGK